MTTNFDPTSSSSVGEEDVLGKEVSFVPHGNLSGCKVINITNFNFQTAAGPHSATVEYGGKKSNMTIEKQFGDTPEKITNFIKENIGKMVQVRQIEGNNFQKISMVFQGENVTAVTTDRGNYKSFNHYIEEHTSLNNILYEKEEDDHYRDFNELISDTNPKRGDLLVTLVFLGETVKHNKCCDEDKDYVYERLPIQEYLNNLFDVLKEHRPEEITTDQQLQKGLKQLHTLSVTRDISEWKISFDTSFNASVPSQPISNPEETVGSEKLEEKEEELNREEQLEVAKKAEQKASLLTEKEEREDRTEQLEIALKIFKELDDKTEVARINDLINPAPE